MAPTQITPLLFAAGLLVGLAAACGTAKSDCSPSSCNGCCDPTTGDCRGGADAIACGIGGGTCNSCSVQQFCQAGACVQLNGGGGGGGGSDAGATDGGGGQDSGTPLDAGAPPDSGVPTSPVDGCWITQTSSGQTQLDLKAAGGIVTGTQSWQGNVYSVDNGTFDGSALQFSVNWANYGFICDYDFPEVSAAALSGTATCSGNVQTITATHSCP